MEASESLDLSRISDAQLEACELSYRRGYLHAVAYLQPDSDYYRKVLRWRYAEPMQLTEPPNYNEPFQ
jgi:hypothetical protein